VPSQRSVVAHLDQSAICQEVAKRRIAVGVSNHFKRVVDAWVAADLIVTNSDLREVRIEKSNILLIGPSGSGMRRGVCGSGRHQRQAVRFRSQNR
jgi:ATP-dependent Clp protease ATP-binding subunit ClpX